MESHSANPIAIENITAEDVETLTTALAPAEVPPFENFTLPMVVSGIQPGLSIDDIIGSQPMTAPGILLGSGFNLGPAVPLNPTVAIGHSAIATGGSSVAIGHSAVASGNNSVAIGHDAVATFDGEVNINGINFSDVVRRLTKMEEELKELKAENAILRDMIHLKYRFTEIIEDIDEQLITDIRRDPTVFRDLSDT